MQSTQRLMTVIVVGAGISGLLAVKHLLEEGVNDVICVDKNDHPYRVWNVGNAISVKECSRVIDVIMHTVMVFWYKHFIDVGFTKYNVYALLIILCTGFMLDDEIMLSWR